MEGVTTLMVVYIGLKVISYIFKQQLLGQHYLNSTHLHYCYQEEMYLNSFVVLKAFEWYELKVWRDSGSDKWFHFVTPWIQCGNSILFSFIGGVLREARPTLRLLPSNSFYSRQRDLISRWRVGRCRSSWNGQYSTDKILTNKLQAMECWTLNVWRWNVVGYQVQMVTNS